MPQKQADPLSSYSVRPFVLTANGYAALPPAQQYIIISATIDPTLVQITVGDANGDAEAWPQGIEIIPGGKLNARIWSPVAQTVQVLMVDGDVRVLDNRSLAPSPLGLNGYTGLATAPAALATGTIPIVAAGANLNGIIVSMQSIAIQATVANGGYGFFSFTQGALVQELLTCYAFVGILQNQQQRSDQLVFIPAGCPLNFDMVAAVAIPAAYSILFKVL